MTALQICSKLRSEIDNNQVKYGYIFSVFKNACNIISNNNELITFLLSEKNIGPMAISMSGIDSILNLGLKKNEEVIFNKNSISISKSNFKLDLSEVSIWDIKPCFEYKKANEQDLKRKVQKFEELLLKYGEKQGMGYLVLSIKDYINDLDTFDKKSISLNSNYSFIIDNFLEFLKNVISSDFDNVEKSAKKIIGFGPGLTPSMDDFITGLMVSLIYLCHYFELDMEKTYKFNRMIISSIKNRTTLISESMLVHACSGYVMESLRACIVSVLSDTSEKDMSKKIIDVISFGSTSGTDMLYGVYIGSKIMINKKIGGGF